MRVNAVVMMRTEGKTLSLVDTEVFTLSTYVTEGKSLTFILRVKASAMYVYSFG